MVFRGGLAGIARLGSGSLQATRLSGELRARNIHALNFAIYRTCSASTGVHGVNRRIVLLATLLLFGCVDTPGASPSLLHDEGDPCRPRYEICLDDELVRQCIDGYWTDRSCEQRCADIGPAMMSAGCSEESVEVDSEGCRCVPLPGFCTPGETRCDSDTELGYCDDSQSWTNYSCEDLCSASLATPISTGCALDDQDLAACWCVDE